MRAQFLEAVAGLEPLRGEAAAVEFARTRAKLGQVAAAEGLTLLILNWFRDIEIVSAGTLATRFEGFSRRP